MSGRAQPTNGADSPPALSLIPRCPVRSGETGARCRGWEGHDGYHDPEPDDTVYTVDVTGGQIVVSRASDDGRITYHARLDAEAARYAALLLNSGIDPDELDAMLQREQCSECDVMAFVAELEPGAGRCGACQS